MGWGYENGWRGKRFHTPYDRRSSTRAREALRQCIPDSLRDSTFSGVLKDDLTVKRWLANLLYAVSEESSVGLKGW